MSVLVITELQKVSVRVTIIHGMHFPVNTVTGDDACFCYCRSFCYEVRQRYIQLNAEIGASNSNIFCLRFKLFSQNVGVNLKASCMKLQSGAGVYHLKFQRPVKFSAGIGSLYGDYQVAYIFEYGYFLQNM